MVENRKMSQSKMKAAIQSEIQALMDRVMNRQSEIQALMDRVMNRVLVEDPFIPEKHWAAKPLYAALVPDEVFKRSHFERRFVTPFGHA